MEGKIKLSRGVSSVCDAPLAEGGERLNEAPLR